MLGILPVFEYFVTFKYIKKTTTKTNKTKPKKKKPPSPEESYPKA